jgi:uncharacterized protein
MRIAIGTGLALPALALVGEALAPPEWDPPFVPEEWANRALPPNPAIEVAEPKRVGDVAREEVRIDVRDDVLEGTVLIPNAPGPHPAVALVLGAGGGSRSALIDQAEYLARHGVASLVYEKRSVGYSFANRDFDLLAEDALAAVRLLRELPEVDAAHVGLWGVSEGGWVVPIAAARSPEVAFAILVSAPNVSPQSQAVWAFDDHIRRIGGPEGLRRALVLALSMSEFNYSRHDPVPALENTRQPVLALYGTNDHAIPLVQSAHVLAQTLERGGNRAYTIRFFEDADHDLRVGDGYAPGYLETMANWILRLPESAEPIAGERIAGAEPVQTRRAVEPPEAPLYGTAPALIGAFGLVAAGYLAGPIAALMVRRRGGTFDRRLPDRWPEIRRALRRATAGGITSSVLVNAGLGLAVASVILDNGSAPLAQGGWLVVRLGGLASLALEVAAIDTTAKAIGDGWRPSPAHMAAVVGVIGGTGVLLVIDAYMGLFAPRW